MGLYMLHHEFLFSAALWWIWRDRNNNYFNEEDPWSKQKVLMLIRHATREHYSFFTDQLSHMSSTIAFHWKAPPIHTFKRDWTATVVLVQRTANYAADHMVKEVARHHLTHSEWLQP
ncbi:hypothetical protein PIB30_019606 [Stylosanthes scabra]|uniref:Uncharacterized protein n=1 Tax=Stylosanthes scabra TaxID=79078 RepID=A0ABU6Q8R5_9FABA|nr:hypothetical protein [Stylosanthes scabra]